MYLIKNILPHTFWCTPTVQRVSRSIKEVFEIIEELIKVKQCQLILVKQGLDLNPSNKNDMTNKILLTIFSMMAELERDFISERTKEGLRARKEQGIIECIKKCGAITFVN